MEKQIILNTLKYFETKESRFKDNALVGLTSLAKKYNIRITTKE